MNVMIIGRRGWARQLYEALSESDTLVVSPVWLPSLKPGGLEHKTFAFRDPHLVVIAGDAEADERLLAGCKVIRAEEPTWDWQWKSRASQVRRTAEAVETEWYQGLRDRHGQMGLDLYEVAS